MAASRGGGIAVRRSASCVALAVALLTAQATWARNLWSGSIGAATDYLYRGISKTNGEPAVHAGLAMQSSNRWSADLWSSTVDLDGDGHVGFELDLHASFAWALGADWSAALGVTHRDYFGESSIVDWDHDELNASLSFQERITASVGWSPNTSVYWYAPLRGRALTYELTVQQPLSAHWLLFAGVGSHDLSDLVDERYSYWSAGVTFTWGAVQFDAAHIGSSAAAERLFGAYASRSRWTGALTIRF